eukprot:TRINITY_DN1698_c0_g2_i1.p1 TRINITY_DN1698_c0_g2~~TRINITY_DN1698_c0_g2_i1.p1  ORF type:complete len:188 (-),score=44.67 TRINITY_DN1698_c0_g2_i1:48-611(-)
MIMRDEQNLSLIKQDREIERHKQVEKFKRKQAEIKKEHNKIDAETTKTISELNEKKIAEVNSIQAQADLEAETIRAQTREKTALIIAEGEANVEKLKAETSAFVQKQKAIIQKNVSTLKAEALEYEGRIEQDVGRMLSYKRDHEAKMRELASLYTMAQNKDISLFSNQNDPVLTQVAALRLTGMPQL